MPSIQMQHEAIDSIWMEPGSPKLNQQDAAEWGGLRASTIRRLNLGLAFMSSALAIVCPSFNPRAAFGTFQYITNDDITKKKLQCLIMDPDDCMVTFEDSLITLGQACSAKACP
jgi:hypothetical protein